MNVVVGPFSVFEIPSGATASLLRSKRQVVPTIPCASIRAVTVRQLSASESFFVLSERSFNAASGVAWQQGLSSKITREQQIPCWASLGFFPGCRGLEASLVSLFLFSSVKSLFNFKRQDKQYQGYLEVSFLPTSPSCFVRLAHDLNPFNTFQLTPFPFPSSLCLKSPTRRFLLIIY